VWSESIKGVTLLDHTTKAPHFILVRGEKIPDPALGSNFSSECTTQLAKAAN